MALVAGLKFNKKKKKKYNKISTLLRSIFFFLAIVASMTIKPTITVNGPRPTVAAVAAGNIHILFIYK
jgi:hypothetical protein